MNRAEMKELSVSLCLGLVGERTHCEVIALRSDFKGSTWNAARSLPASLNLPVQRSDHLIEFCYRGYTIAKKREKMV